jgi:hypothetical protein
VQRVWVSHPVGVYSFVQGARLLDTRNEQIPTAAAAIKTMVLVQQDLNSPTQQAPGVAVLLLAGHKVDLRAAAQHMQLPKGSLRLATAEEAEAITGYELGCIPPLGERVQLTGSLGASAPPCAELGGCLQLSHFASQHRLAAASFWGHL